MKSIEIHPHTFINISFTEDNDFELKEFDYDKAASEFLKAFEPEVCDSFLSSLKEQIEI